MNVLLRNARLAGGELTDILLTNDRIAARGAGLPATLRTDPESSTEETGRAARTLDLEGRFVIPGLWDNHVHFDQWAMAARRLDVSAATSAEEAANLVRQRLALGNPADQNLLIGAGFRDGLWPVAPGLEVLDAATGHTPVVLASGDLHCVWLNSAALAEYGFAGHPTGLLREEHCFEVTRAIGNVADSVLDKWTDEAAQQAAARGVVGIVDLEMRWMKDSWLRRVASGSRSLRVEFGVYTEHLERAIELGLRTGQEVGEQFAGEQRLLTVGPYKVITDGSLNTRTAYCFDEYPGMEGSPGSRGLNTVPPAELVSLMRLAWGNGIVPAVHAIGDHANRLALDAFEEVGCPGSVEHAQLLTGADVSRFAALGVTASVQPEHAMDDRDVTDRYWAGRTERAFPFAELIAAGARLAFGSDAPVAPLDPWVSMAAAVGRSRDGRESWHPEQTVSRKVALAASTRGSVEVGQVADLAVVEIDPLEATVDELRGMPVAATLLGGRFTWNAL